MLLDSIDHHFHGSNSSEKSFDPARPQGHHPLKVYHLHFTEPSNLIKPVIDETVSLDVLINNLNGLSVSHTLNRYSWLRSYFRPSEYILHTPALLQIYGYEYRSVSLDLYAYLAYFLFVSQCSPFI